MPRFLDPPSSSNIQYSNRNGTSLHCLISGTSLVKRFFGSTSKVKILVLRQKWYQSTLPFFNKSMKHLFLKCSENLNVTILHYFTCGIYSISELSHHCGSKIYLTWYPFISPFTIPIVFNSLPSSIQCCHKLTIKRFWNQCDTNTKY